MEIAQDRLSSPFIARVMWIELNKAWQNSRYFFTFMLRKFHLHNGGGTVVLSNDVIVTLYSTLFICKTMRNS